MEYVACNLCGSVNSEVLYPSTLPESPAAEDIEHLRCTSASYGKHHTIVKCRNCGLVYANPHRQASAILHDYEEVVDPLYLKEREGRVLTFQRNLRPLEELMPPAQGRRLLDVGCHIGVFLEMHLYYFSPRTLREMLGKAGFTVVKMVNQGRFLRLGYLTTRIEPYSSLIARGMRQLVTAFDLKDKAVPINLGDLFTTFARKD